MSSEAFTVLEIGALTTLTQVFNRDQALLTLIYTKWDIEEAGSLLSDGTVLRASLSPPPLTS